jgi:hypothetical protein
MHPGMVASLIIVFLLVCPALSGQAHVVIGGSIPCMGQIALAGDSVGSSRAIVTELKADESNRASVTLRLRTNCRFHVAARLRDPTAGEAQVISGAVTAAAGTDHLTPKALETQVRPATFASGIAAAFLDGPPISRSGNNTTSDNAVLVQVVLQLPPGVRTTSAEFSLTLGN